MSLLEVIASRRSVGRVLPDPLPREDVEALLEAAVSAPNHHLTAPWRFVVLAGDARRELGEAHARAVARAKPDLPAEGLAKEAGRLERAPVVIAAVVLGSDDPVQAREDRDAVAAAIENLLLAAHGSGLGAMWRTGAMVNEPEVLRGARARARRRDRRLRLPRPPGGAAPRAPATPRGGVRGRLARVVRRG